MLLCENKCVCVCVREAPLVHTVNSVSEVTDEIRSDCNS